LLRPDRGFGGVRVVVSGASDTSPLRDERQTALET